MQKQLIQLFLDASSDFFDLKNTCRMIDNWRSGSGYSSDTTSWYGLIHGGGQSQKWQ